MKIYINNFTKPIRAEILPNDTPTLDETLETFSFALMSTSVAKPFAPMQKVKIDFNDDGTSVEFFYIMSDSVETFSLCPLKYKHSITCIQNTRKLSKHVVRNSVFSQPGYLRKESFNAESEIANGYSSGETIGWNNPNIPSINWASEPLVLTDKEKIKSARFKMSFQWCRENNDPTHLEAFATDHTVDDILAKTSLVESLSIDRQLVLRYTDAEETIRWEYVSPSDFGLIDFDLNGIYNFPRIKTLADQGCNNFQLLFEHSEFITGTYIVNDVHNPPPNYNTINRWMVQIQIIAEVYYYTAYDILDLLLKRQQKETRFDMEDRLFVLPYNTNGEKPQYDELKELLEKTVAPNFIFTQLTMYECVAEVFRLFDAIFTMDEEDVLGIEYFNDLSGEELVNAKFVGRTLSMSEDKYTNGLIADYQDARVEETFPKSDRYANLRSEEFGVPEAQDHSFIVPHKINVITKCLVSLSEFKANDGAINIDANGTDFALDITRHVVDKSVWSTLSGGTITYNTVYYREVKQATALYYTQGDNKIQVAATFKSSWGITEYVLFNIAEIVLNRMAGTDGGYNATDALKGHWDDIRMSLTYTASVDGRTKVHSTIDKYSGESLIDQSNGGVDLNKFGLNMLGLSLKLGNPTLNATHKITKWSNRIKTGQIYRYQDALWVANVVSYTFMNGFIQGKISFIQNFNQLALRTKLLREKRMTNISSELTQKSEEVMTEYLYLSTEPIMATALGICFNFDYVKQFLVDSFKVNGSQYKIGDAFVYQETDYLLGVVDGTYIPMVTYGAGNTLNFEMSFEHPKSAGNQTDVNIAVSGHLFGYFTKYVSYTDDYGFMDEVYIKAPDSVRTYNNKFPKVKFSTNSKLTPTDGFFNIVKYKVYKQPNEIFALNYQIAVMVPPGRENIDFIGSELINNNAFVQDFTKKGRECFICVKREKSSVLDTKATPFIYMKKITDVSLVNVGSDRASLRFYFNHFVSADLEGMQSWVIVDSEYNVLFASNNMILNQEDYVDINFITRPNRIIIE